ncbi:hypothetical protein K458DRAFT_396526 [Lentithecium fluviatile CBS 122367]|uniref:J domain-containing protein n=1 Tax=Lentithecium fluviatile CBS 122367 TaxID=1168545 RepID=A0A6G1IFR1_9PLEO|nr:hypothetical protein K458DRAFT_396526 [Lentithecium fluviatile CBS 122367]
MPNHYETVGLEPGCTDYDIRRAFRTTSLQNRPDKDSSKRETSGKEDEDNQPHDYDEKKASHRRIFESTLNGITLCIDGILWYRAEGWDVQIQLDLFFADIVGGEIDSFSGSEKELHLYVEI